jgi:epoxyqueuosine reductase QueG
MPALTIEELRQYAQKYVDRYMADKALRPWWQMPLMVSAPIDGRFAQLPRIAAASHLQPRDLLATAKSLVVFFIPFQRWVIRENRGGERPVRSWGEGYVLTNQLISDLSQALAEKFKAAGFRAALTPPTANFDPEQLMADWSHKHLGYLAGLGHFGTHCLLITPAGCCGRLGSLVTEADLGDHPLITTDQACLLKAGFACGKCLDACPVEALAESSFQRRVCYNRLRENRATLPELADFPQNTSVCGKCAMIMPCSFINPVEKALRGNTPRE